MLAPPNDPPPPIPKWPGNGPHPLRRPFDPLEWDVLCTRGHRQCCGDSVECPPPPRPHLELGGRNGSPNWEACPQGFASGAHRVRTPTHTSVFRQVCIEDSTPRLAQQPAMFLPFNHRYHTPSTGLLLTTRHHWGGVGWVPPPPPLPPALDPTPALKDWAKLSSGPSANQKFCSAPSAPLWGGGGGSNDGTPRSGNDTSKSTGRSGRQKAATRRNMRREERVTVQGPVKEQQPDGMSHRGAGPPCCQKEPWPLSE